MKAGRKHSVNLIVEKKNQNNYVWSKSIDVVKDKTINLQKIKTKKEWNMIFFVSDKANSLKDWVDSTIDYLEVIDKPNNINLFIIKGQYWRKYNDDSEIVDSWETNKGYYVTNYENIEIVDYGDQNFGDADFYRNEIQKIKEKYPSEHTYVSIFSHGSGWDESGIEMSESVPNTNPFIGALSADHSKKYENQRGIHDAIDTKELYAIFEGIEVDFLDINACSMGTVEVLNDLPNSIKYVSTSPSTTYANISSLEGFMEDVSNGITNLERLGKNHVDRAIESFEYQDEGTTKTLYNMKYSRDLPKKMKSLTDALYNNLNNNPENITKFAKEVIYSNDKVQTYWKNETRKSQNDSKDLVGIIDYLINNKNSYGDEVYNAAQEVKTVLDNYIAYHRYTEGQENKPAGPAITGDVDMSNMNYKKSKGLTIYVGKFSSFSYKETWFNEEAQWYRIIDLMPRYEEL